MHSVLYTCLLYYISVKGNSKKWHIAPLNCLLFAGVLHLMETGDVQKKDLIEHPENYILLTTLDEGLFSYISNPFSIRIRFQYERGKVIRYAVQFHGVFRNSWNWVYIESLDNSIKQICFKTPQSLTGSKGYCLFLSVSLQYVINRFENWEATWANLNYTWAQRTFSCQRIWECSQRN